MPAREHDRRLDSRAPPFVHREQRAVVVDHRERARRRRARRAARAPRTWRRARPRAPVRASTTTRSRSRIASVGVSTAASGSASIASSGRASSSVNRRRGAGAGSEVRAAAERGAEVGRERADVGAARARDPDRRPRGTAPRSNVFDVELVDAHRPGGALDLHRPRARARSRRRPPIFIADTIGGTCSMSPTNARAAASSSSRRELHLGAFEHRARRVERVGRDAEHDAAAVLLPRLLQEAQQPRGATEADEQHAGGVGIERARVADAASGRRRRAAWPRRRATSSPAACRRRPTRRARSDPVDAGHELSITARRGSARRRPRPTRRS